MSVEREVFEGGPLDGYERRAVRARPADELALRHGGALGKRRCEYGHVVSDPDIGLPVKFETGVALNVYRLKDIVKGRAVYEYIGGRRAG